MLRQDFIKLIGTETVFDYPFGRELQVWSMENFIYNAETDTITHNRLDLIIDVIIKKS